MWFVTLTSNTGPILVLPRTNHNTKFLLSGISFLGDIEFWDIFGTIQSLRHFLEFESIVLIPRWMAHTECCFCNSGINASLFGWRFLSCTSLPIDRFRLFSWSCWCSSCGTPWNLKSTSGAMVTWSATGRPGRFSWIWPSCRICQTLLRTTFGGRRGDKRIFWCKISPVVRFTTFSRQSAGTDLLRLIALECVCQTSILCLEHFSSWSNELHSGTLSISFDMVPFVALSRRKVRLVKDTVLSSLFWIFPSSNQTWLNTTLVIMGRTNVINIFSSIVRDFHTAVTDQLCFLQSGLGWHACTECFHWSPSNTGFFYFCFPSPRIQPCLLRPLQFGIFAIKHG